MQINTYELVISSYTQMTMPLSYTNDNNDSPCSRIWQFDNEIGIQWYMCLHCVHVVCCHTYIFKLYTSDYWHNRSVFCRVDTNYKWSILWLLLSLWHLLHFLPMQDLVVDQTNGVQKKWWKQWVRCIHVEHCFHWLYWVWLNIMPITYGDFQIIIHVLV